MEGHGLTFTIGRGNEIGKWISVDHWQSPDIHTSKCIYSCSITALIFCSELKDDGQVQKPWDTPSPVCSLSL